MNQRILAVDGGIIHAYYRATGKDDLSATFFAAAIERFSFKWQCPRVIVAFDCDHDCDERSFRYDVYDAYKANRQRDPDDQRELDEQKQAAWDMLAAKHHCVMRQGMEADDVLASIAAQSDMQVVIWSPDKDLRQCLEKGRVVIARSWSKAKGPVWYSAADLWDEYGITPQQWIDYQCLIGDTIDNIPGCPGIGPVGAKDILHGRFLDDIFDKPECMADVPAKYVKKLEAWRAMYPVTRQLVELRTDLEIPDGTLQPVQAPF